MIIKHGRHFGWEMHEVRKGIWAFFLGCASRMLIGWAGKLWSRGKKKNEKKHAWMQISYLLEKAPPPIKRLPRLSAAYESKNIKERRPRISAAFINNNAALNRSTILRSTAATHPGAAALFRVNTVGDFRVAFRLCFKASPSAKSLYGN